MTRALAPTPNRWPDDRRFAVVITVNFDSELALLGPDPAAASLDKTLSIFRYGAIRGAPRLLDTFAERGVRTTWFVPGAMVAPCRALLGDVVAAGHGLGARGMRLERMDRLTVRERLDVLRASRQALAEVTATGEPGFRLPSGEWPPDLGAQLLEAGFGWSSSWTGDDVPFCVPAGEGRSIVEIPFIHALSDRLAFAWNFAPAIPEGQSRIASYEDVLENWCLELEGCRREGLCLVLQLHPEVAGTPGRIDLVWRFLDAVVETGDAWVATGAQVASWWRAHAHGGPEHPVDLLRRVSPSSLA
ncbi:MAG TPA: polysaccharide deacetylase family protein [Acidimicrobiales bacterium]|nr:polysaccharide deacetylase family protein [Acidimicrobiales bacterium]